MASQDWFSKDFYAALGVPKNADEAAIKKAYRQLAKDSHPDRNPGDAKAEQRFKEGTEAYTVLSDPDQRKQYDLSSLRYMVHGAAPCPKEVKRAMIDWWGPVVIDYYAATEGGGALITSEEWLRKPGSVGRAWPGSEIKVFDDDGNEAPAGEAGTVYMKMANSDFSYKGDPDKTRKNPTSRSMAPKRAAFCLPLTTPRPSTLNPGRLNRICPSATRWSMDRV